MMGQKILRVCFAMFGAYPLFNPEVNETFGGSEVELYNLAVYLAGFRHIKVDFIVGDYGQDAVEYYKDIRLIKVKYMHLERYKSVRHKLLRYFHLFRVLLGQNSDIFFTKTAAELLGWLVIFEKFLKRKKVVFRLGSDKDAEPEFLKKDRKLYYLYKLGLKHCNLVYSQSKDQKLMLGENFGKESCVLKNVFRINNSRVDNTREYFLWVSRCEPLKRPLVFIELARRLPGEKFVIIMPHVQKTDRLQREEIDNITVEVKKAAGELENLEYIESVPFSQIQAYYNRARLFVNTSEYEGFPNSFIQACLGHTGILSLKVNPDGFLTEYGLGHCCGDDIEEAVSFIKGLDAARLEEMGSRAFDYVMRNHDISSVGKLYIDDFRELIKH